MKCRICGSVVAHLFSLSFEGRSYDVARCAECEHVQTIQLPEISSPEYAHLEGTAINRDRLWCQGEHKAPAFRKWWRGAQLFSEHRPNRVLDVGCGTGGFLDFASKLGLRCYGFDLSWSQAEFARKRHPGVRPATSIGDYIEQLGARPRFDLITLWDVLEHLTDPVKTLAELREHLAVGGLLFCSTPNGRAMELKRRVAELVGRDLRSAFVPWEHLAYFTCGSLTKMSERLGMDVVEMGAEACYPRPLTIHEAFRRAGFALLRFTPAFAPQLYVWLRSRAREERRQVGRPSLQV